VDRKIDSPNYNVQEGSYLPGPERSFRDTGYSREFRNAHYLALCASICFEHRMGVEPMNIGIAGQRVSQFATEYRLM
jgi:hypothetical protein